MLENTLFYLISFWVIVSAIGVVSSRTAVYSVLWLVSVMCGTAVFFVLLNAFLIAAIQVLVYAGAILVLFLFVVMLTDTGQKTERRRSIRLFPVLAILFTTVFFTQACFVIRSIQVPASDPLYGTAEAIGRLLFSQYTLPFELTAFLLLAAVISIVVLAKKAA